jgi:hypothetical protein
MVPRACCRQLASERTIRDAWTILCSALTNAVTEELRPKNVASLPDLGSTVRRCPLASTAVGGDCYSLGYSVARDSMARAVVGYGHLTSARVLHFRAVRSQP